MIDDAPKAKKKEVAGKANFYLYGSVHGLDRGGAPCGRGRGRGAPRGF